MHVRRWAKPVLGGILLALCFLLVIRSVWPACSSDNLEAAERYAHSNRMLSLEPIALPSGDININTAGLDELDALPGIGPVTAQAIIDARESGGNFYYPEDLLDVRGIGDKTVEKLRDLITVTEEEP